MTATPATPEQPKRTRPGTRRMESAVAYGRLSAAMLDTPPACRNDFRFTLDDPAHDNELAEICTGCPLYALCHAYAEIERPKGGLWAGKRYTQSAAGRTDES